MTGKNNSQQKQSGFFRVDWWWSGAIAFTHSLTHFIHQWVAAALQATDLQTDIATCGQLEPRFEPLIFQSSIHKLLYQLSHGCRNKTSSVLAHRPILLWCFYCIYLYRVFTGAAPTGTNISMNKLPWGFFLIYLSNYVFIMATPSTDHVHSSVWRHLTEYHCTLWHFTMPTGDFSGFHVHTWQL